MRWVEPVPTPAVPVRLRPARIAVPAPYLPLYAYLDGRFADRVVLTFREIEDLLGFSLPEPAGVQQEWWGNGGLTSGPTSHSCSWTQASRTATPNLPAKTVTFERRAA